MTEPTGMMAFKRHDHGRCVEDAIAATEAVCRKRRLRLTPIRRRALEILLEEHRALGAYDVLERLKAEGLGSHPPAAYRALDFLTEHGFAHKVERLNRFVACAAPEEGHRPAFLICRDCGHVAEAADGAVDRALDRAAKAGGFALEAAAIEAIGLCPACQDAP